MCCTNHVVCVWHTAVTTSYQFSQCPVDLSPNLNCKPPFFLTTFPTHFYRVWYTDLFIRSCLGHLSNMSRFNWVRWVRKDLWTGRQIVTRTSCALSGAKIQTSTKTQQIASCLGAVYFWWSTISIRSLIRLVPSDLLNTEKLVLLFDWYGSIYSYQFLRLESCFLR